MSTLETGRGRVAALVLVLVAALAGATAAAAATHEKAHKHHCAKGQMAHRGRCLRTGLTGTKIPASLPLQSALVAAAKAPQHAAHGKRAVPKADIAKAVRALKGLDAAQAAIGRVIDTAQGASAATLRRRAHAAASDTATIDAGGWKGDATLDVPVHDDQTGDDVSVDVTIKNDKGVTEQGKETRKRLVAQCPDAQGHVPGSAEESFAATIDVPLKEGYEVKLTWSAKATFDIQGQTANDGTLHDWQQSMDFLFHIQWAIVHDGKVVQTNAPALWTMKAHDDLTPGTDHTNAHIDDFQAPETFHLFGKTYYDPTSAYGKVTSKINELAGFLWMWVSDDIEREFANAKSRHWDSGDCVKLSLTAPKQQLAPAESVAITAKPSGAPSRGVAPATLTESASHGGTVTPPSTTADASGAQLTAIAPSPFSGDDRFEVTVNAVSKQGRGSASITFTAIKQHLALVYAHASTDDAAFHYDRSQPPYLVDYGDKQEHRDIALTATLPLTAGADGTLSGSGPLTWTRKTWTKDDNKTNTNTGGGTCTQDYQWSLVDAASGTASVAGVKLDPAPTVDFHMTALPESWHVHEIAEAGPCPVFDQDLTSNSFDQSFYFFHYNNGDKPNETYDNGDPKDLELHVDSGWQAGSGDVLWTRTFTGPTPNPTAPDGSHSGTYTDTFQIVRTS